MKAVVTEVPICRCTGSDLERMAASCFKPGTAVPRFFKCPCGHRYPVRPPTKP